MHLLQAFQSAIFCTIVQQLTRFPLSYSVAWSLCDSWACWDQHRHIMCIAMQCSRANTNQNVSYIIIKFGVTLFSVVRHKLTGLWC